MLLFLVSKYIWILYITEVAVFSINANDEIYLVYTHIFSCYSIDIEAYYSDSIGMTGCIVSLTILL